MADRFYGRLRQLERDSKNEMTILSDSRSSLDQLTEAMAGQELSLNDYLTLLRLTGQNYERYSMPPSAQKYVFMRMQSVLTLGKEKWKRRQYPLLTDTEVPLQPEIETYLQQQRPLWRDLLLHYQRILVVTDLVLFLAILPLLVFVVKFSFLWSLIVSLLIWAGLAVYFQLFCRKPWLRNIWLRIQRKSATLCGSLSSVLSVPVCLPERNTGLKTAKIPETLLGFRLFSHSQALCGMMVPVMLCVQIPCRKPRFSATPFI